jgi:uncharacterized membrane protein
VSSRSDFLPPLPAEILLLALAVIVLAWVLLRLACGAPVDIARRRGFIVFRVAILGIVTLILANPVQVNEAPGKVNRPDVFYLLDSSQSMAIGKTESRWEESLAFIAAAGAELGNADVGSSLHLFRFGHRLTAFEQNKGPALTDTKQPPGRSSAAHLSAAPAPTDSDTRLAEALRQLTSRFGRQQPASVVLFSDGRVRDADAVQELAKLYGRQNVPIHIYAAGDTTSGGDIALVSLVAPRHVRKFSTVDVQVFLRSFGYDGERSEVKIMTDAEMGGPPIELASTPITLRSGVQSVTLSYRSDMRGRRLHVVLPARDDELSTRNNSLETEVGIDRTKIRVLYVEGSPDPLRPVQRGDRWVQLGPHSPLQEALSQDEDIECVPLVVQPGLSQLMRLQGDTTATGRAFPETKAELAAFDAVILSNARRQFFTDEQIEWLEQWVNVRGGGLCMVGGPDSFSAGGWRYSPIGEMLPVSLEADEWSATLDVTLLPPPEAMSHSIWSIVADRKQNEQIIRSMPALLGANQRLEPKALSTVLATTVLSTPGGTDVNHPVMVSGPYGRGRALSLAVPTTAPWARNFMNNWGSSGNHYSAKFWRNVVYWLTENSSIGRRRLVADVDKQFYQPGETISLKAVTYNEAAQRTTNYRVWGMVEPRSLEFNDESLYSSLRWPSGLPREGGEESPYMTWGEEFELTRNRETGEYEVPLEIAERLRSGTDNQGLRVELTAYEGAGPDASLSRGTQVDSTSVDIQILHDPFEQQNPFPNHDLLRRVASLSGGKALSDPTELAALIHSLPIEQGPSIVRKVPTWSTWWLWATLVTLLTAEWVWRRAVGLA